MTKTEIPPEKIRAYEATHYRSGVGPEALELWIGQHSPDLASRYKNTGADCALFITAFNPFGQEQVRYASEDAHARLELVQRVRNEIEFDAMKIAIGWRDRTIDPGEGPCTGSSAITTD